MWLFERVLIKIYCYWNSRQQMTLRVNLLRITPNSQPFFFWRIRECSNRNIELILLKSPIVGWKSFNLFLDWNSTLFRWNRSLKQTVQFRISYFRQPLKRKLQWSRTHRLFTKVSFQDRPPTFNNAHISSLSRPREQRNMFFFPRPNWFCSIWRAYILLKY